jgi:serine/threonine protein kinase
VGCGRAWRLTREVSTVPEEMIGGYRLVKHMATGQSSQVWEVVEGASHRHFALKVLLPEKAHDPLHRRFLFHEAEVGKKLAHPNIIRIVAIIRDPDNPCFIMEFFPAGSLKLRLLLKQSEFLHEKAFDLFKQSATALAFMHSKGWVHRDIKPDNFLANSAGELRLIDFALAQQIPTGLARFFSRKQRAQGTRSYMSPEQIRGQILDGRADIYSLGITWYELVTGRPPFRGLTAQDLLVKQITEKPVAPKLVNPDVTDEFSELVLHMLAKKKEDRPRTCHEVLIALRSLKVYKTDSTQATGA